MTTEQPASVLALMETFAQVYTLQGGNLFLEPWERDLTGMGPRGNPHIITATRALREVAGWWMFLLLTPWCLVRILIPPADHQQLDSWREAGSGIKDLALGQPVTLVIDGSERKAHLEFHEALGVHFIEPLVLNMTGYRGNDEVFAAHERVIATRDGILARTGRSCTRQTEISRRELFSPFRKLAGGAG
ncbi:MAG: hypothetical protein HQL76_17645 [Magnetococcales bacterium]|nr:hypothetical protein [Magnetococcales bacterium]